MKQTIKALILSHSSEMSGAEKSMVDLFTYWTKNYDIEPTFIIKSPTRNMAGELSRRGWNYIAMQYTNWVQRNPETNPAITLRFVDENARAVRKIKKIIDEIKPDVVITNTIVAPWAALAAYDKDIPHVWFVREYGDLDQGYVFAMNRDKTFKDIGNLSDLVITNSKVLAEHMTTYIDENKIMPLYNPFSIETLQKLSKTKVKNPFNNKNSLKLVIVGRVSPSKGQADVAEAVGLLRDQGLAVELCIVGAPSDKADTLSLLSVIEKYKIEQYVHILGQQKNPIAYASLADIGVTASKLEAFGRITFEYMAIGKPAVGANTGGTLELIDDDKTGYLYKQGSPNDLVVKLKKYIEDPTLLKTHGQAAKQKARAITRSKYNPDIVYERLSEIIQTHTKNTNKVYYHDKLQEYKQQLKALPIHHKAYVKSRRVAKIVYTAGRQAKNRIKNSGHNP